MNFKIAVVVILVTILVYIMMTRTVEEKKLLEWDTKSKTNLSTLIEKFQSQPDVIEKKRYGFAIWKFGKIMIELEDENDIFSDVYLKQVHVHDKINNKMKKIEISDLPEKNNIENHNF